MPGAGVDPRHTDRTPARRPADHDAVRARTNLDRHANYVLAAYMSAGTRTHQRADDRAHDAVEFRISTSFVEARKLTNARQRPLSQLPLGSVKIGHQSTSGGPGAC
jgi:hypothetical protein